MREHAAGSVRALAGGRIIYCPLAAIRIGFEA